MEADALDLVPGGYGTAPTERPMASDEPVQVPGASAPTGLALDFTPRDPNLWTGTGSGDTTAGDVHFGLTAVSYTHLTLPTM